MKANRYDSTGKSTGTVDLPAAVFGGPYSLPLIHQTIRTELRNRRQGTHKTKGISEIQGTGKKPWRQKGTGSARAGSMRATQWRGGQTVFGPTPRSYRLQLPKKMRRAGIRGILSKRAEQKAIVVMEDMTLEDFKTRQVADAFKQAGFIPGNTITYVTSGASEQLVKSVMGLQTVRMVSAERVTAPELYYCSQLVLTDSALKYINSAYAAPEGVRKK